MFVTHKTAFEKHNLITDDVTLAVADSHHCHQKNDMD